MVLTLPNLVGLASFAATAASLVVCLAAQCRVRAGLITNEEN